MAGGCGVMCGGVAGDMCMLVLYCFQCIFQCYDHQQECDVSAAVSYQQSVYARRDSECASMKVRNT